jgi:hypothetical protein
MGRPSTLVATLTREMVATKWAIGYRNLQFPPASAASMLTGMPFDHARNTACENMLNNNFEWLFYLDDDVVAPPDTIQRLINHGKDIVSGVYHRRASPHHPVMLRFDAQDQAQWVLEYPPNQLIEVDLVGAGCLLIHRRVLERMSKPWFEWQLGKEDPKPEAGVKAKAKLSEDFAFCLKAKREFGFQIYVDTSIQCEHIGLGQAQVGGAFIPSSV